jgi:hypothetical protein
MPSRQIPEDAVMHTLVRARYNDRQIVAIIARDYGSHVTRQAVTAWRNRRNVPRVGSMP